MTTTKKAWPSTVAKVVAVIFGLYLITWVSGLGEVNGRIEEINVKTGQARYSYSFLFIRFNMRIEDTLFSTALDGDEIDVADIDPWHTVTSFVPWSNVSSHYRFHDAFGDMSKVRTICAEQPDPEACTEEMAREVMKRWQDPITHGSSWEFLIPRWHDVINDDEHDGDVGSE